MTEEFNLSEKQKKTDGRDYSNCLVKDCPLHRLCYDEKDVKEFIKRLKEDFLNEWESPVYTYEKICKMIDKRAGDTLSQEKA